jgi:regulatory protein
MKARPTPLEAAAKALARRDRSAAALAAYLEQRGTTRDDATVAVERLQQAGYVDDGRYANARAEMLADRGYGNEAIRFELERDGVAAEEVEAALASVVPERDRALALVDRARDRRAAIRRLAAKGFSPDSVEAALAAAGLDPATD